jgi:hypothetical protein
VFSDSRVSHESTRRQSLGVDLGAGARGVLLGAVDPSAAASTLERATMTERERLFARARRTKAEIEQIFTDCALWNEHSTARKNGAAPIDPDPDGSLTIALAYVNGILSGDVYVAPETRRGRR